MEQYKLVIKSGTGVISDDGLTVSKQDALNVITNRTIELQKYYFEITFTTNGYKNSFFDNITVNLSTRYVGTVGFEVDHTTKTIRVYTDGVLKQTVNYTQETIPQLLIYMNEDSLTIFNFGSQPFKYGSPNHYPAIDSFKYLFKDGEDIKTFKKAKIDKLVTLLDAAKADGENPATSSLITWKDLVGNSDGTLYNFLFNSSSGWIGNGSESSPYALSFGNNNERVEIPLNPSANYVFAYKISFSDISDNTNCTIISSSSIYHQAYASNLAFSTLWSDNTKSYANIQLIANKEYDVVVDMFNKKIYVDGIDVTTDFNVSWTHETYDNIIIGKSYYKAFKGYLRNFYIYNSPLSLEEIEQNDQAYIESWVTIGTAPATKEMFERDGMDFLPIIDNKTIQQLVSDTPELLCWIDREVLSNTLNMTAIPKPQLLIPTEDIKLENINSFTLNSTVSGLGDLKILISNDSGNNWEGKTSVDISDLISVKANGFTPEEFNSLTKEELMNMFPEGKARIAFYLEQESSTDIVEIDSLIINEKEYTISPIVENLSVIYEVLESNYHPTIYVSRDDGVNWMEVERDELTELISLPEGTKLRVKIVLENGQELYALSYSWI